ncbi:hypothetical protein TA3x_005036 [Tundrisphaera sp. TA3]|uniref:hypothetical protein n=1 Tax=Tundrisphaera sp. TA3 TaxID=3435775 RepID=UPI003EBF92C0
MDHFVPIDRALPGLSVPPDMGDRFAYDADRRALRFRGFMSKADFDRLSRLSEDWSYRRALESLFRDCTVEDGRPGRMASLLSWLVPRRLGHG